MMHCAGVEERRGRKFSVFGVPNWRKPPSGWRGVLAGVNRDEGG